MTRKLLPGDKEGKKALRLPQAAVGHKEVSPLCVQNLLSLMAYILLHSPMMSLLQVLSLGGACFYAECSRVGDTLFISDNCWC